MGLLPAASNCRAHTHRKPSRSEKKYSTLPRGDQLSVIFQASGSVTAIHCPRSTALWSSTRATKIRVWRMSGVTAENATHSPSCESVPLYILPTAGTSLLICPVAASSRLTSSGVEIGSTSTEPPSKRTATRRAALVAQPRNCPAAGRDPRDIAPLIHEGHPLPAARQF